MKYKFEFGNMKYEIGFWILDFWIPVTKDTQEEKV